MDRHELHSLILVLIDTHEKFEAMFKAESQSSRLAQRLRLPLSDHAARLEVACQAIDDAVNVLQRGFIHGE